MATPRDLIFTPLEVKPIYYAVKERRTNINLHRRTHNPHLMPVIYDISNYKELLEKSRVEQRKIEDQSTNLITKLRFVVTTDDKLKFGAIGIPSISNSIPAHRDLTPEEKCTFPGDVSFNSNDEICVIDNSSGGFQPKMISMQYGFMAFYKENFKFAENVQLIEVPHGQDKLTINHYSRENLIKKIEKLIKDYKDMENTKTSQVFSPPNSAEKFPSAILSPIDQNSPSEQQSSPLTAFLPFTSKAKDSSDEKSSGVKPTKLLFTPDSSSTKRNLKRDFADLPTELSSSSYATSTSSNFTSILRESNANLFANVNSLAPRASRTAQLPFQITPGPGRPGCNSGSTPRLFKPPVASANSSSNILLSRYALFNTSYLQGMEIKPEQEAIFNSSNDSGPNQSFDTPASKRLKR
jgi:hypothetical protein